MSYQGISIREVLDKINANTNGWYLPEVQRQYVWGNPSKMVPKQGMASKIRILESRRSVKSFSSASVAILFLGPTLTQIRPR